MDQEILNDSFLAACNEGNLNIVKEFINNNDLDIEFLNKGFKNACNKGYLDIVKFLLEKKSIIDINTNTNTGTPLVYSIYNGHLDVAKFLIKKGAKININNIYGTPIKLACEKGHLDIVKILVEKNEKLAKDITAILAACKGDQLEIVKFLIRHGANRLNAQNLNDSKDNNIKKYLKLEAIVDSILGPNYEHYEDKNIIEKIIDAVKKNPSIVNLFPKDELDKIPEIEPLVKSDEYGLFENVNIDELNDILLSAALQGNLKKVKSVIKQGADIEARDIDDDDDTPLIFAGYYSNLNIVKFLVRHGANIEAKNKFNNTVLTQAILEKDLNIIEYLKNDAWIESTLGIDYDYTKDRKQQIIDAIKINPSIINKLDKEELKNIPEIQHLLKSEEYGLFERKIKNYKQWKNI